jgi:hypothetical protein
MSKSGAVDVPDSIGPVVFGVGIGWVTIRSPRQDEDLPAEKAPAIDSSR